MIFTAIALAATTAYSIYSQKQGQKGQDAISEYNASVRLEKGETARRAKLAQSQINNDVRQKQQASNRVSFSNRGIDITVGSPLRVLTEELADDMADANEELRQANISRIRGGEEAKEIGFQSRIKSQTSQRKMIGTGIGAGASLLSMKK